MTISMKSKIVRSSDPIAEVVDDELVMADIDAGKYYGLNDIGTAIWQNLETKITVEDLCKRLCETYEVTTEQCSAEVMIFLKDLETRGLISVEG
ncbi:MAG: PqqD family peptide modification chaperone [Clostridiaceae bacterium]